MFVARVFMASSKRAQPLAEILQEMLANQEWEKEIRVAVRPWYKDAVFTSGTETLNALVRTCREDADFAIVFFTRDDIYEGTNPVEALPPAQAGSVDQPKNADGDHPNRSQIVRFKARDNCVFEAGLFIGGLDLDPERCFLIVSVAKSDLPTDLQGLTYLPLDEDTTSTREAYKSKLEEVAKRIIEGIKKKKRFDRPKLASVPADLLLVDERPAETGGCLVEPLSVFVSSSQPLESGEDNEFAKRVMANLQVPCNYKYFLRDTQNLGVIANLIQALGAVGLEAKYRNERLVSMAKYPDVAKQNLEMLRKHLQIYFVKSQLFYCCIYNVQKEEHAVCYLKYEGGKTPEFIKWYEKEPAMKRSEALTKLYEGVRNPDQPGIFRSTREFDIYSDGKQEFRKQLLQELHDCFPKDLHKCMENVCFGSAVEQRTLLGSPRRWFSSHRSWLLRRTLVQKEN